MITSARFDYVMHLFEKIYDCGDLRELVSYGLGGEHKIQIRVMEPDDFGGQLKVDISKVVWKAWKGENIPFLFADQDREILTFEENRTVINFDIIVSSFFLLSGLQEIHCPERDRFGRFPFSQSIQHKLNVVDKPIVNYYFDILKTSIERTIGARLSNNLWKKFDFAVCLTHDIDTCQSAWLQGSFRALRQFKIGLPFKLILQKLFKDDAWFNFDRILEIESEFDAHSSFYFLCRKEKSFGIENADYDITHPKFKQVYQAILDSGSEIGIHGSFGAHNSELNLREDLNRLNFDAVGGRFHFLEFEMGKTPGILEQVGLKYDSTLGFAEHFGFRNSFCFPFNLYDVHNDKPLNVVEIPLVLMDATLQFPHYMNLKQDEVLPKIENLLRQIKMFGGCFTLLWHNTHYSDYKYEGWREVLIEILQLCKAENAFIGSGEEIFEEFARTR